jgi:sphingolipid delta-4 desaturase
MARSAATTAVKEAKPPAASAAKDAKDDKQHDFFWTYTEEPHRTRRLAIIKAHPEARKDTSSFSRSAPIDATIQSTASSSPSNRYPSTFFNNQKQTNANMPPSLLQQKQVLKLCGPEPLTKYVVAGVVGLQVLLAYMLRSTPFWSWQFWAVAYVFGATANQNLFLAIHEISHNLAFRSPLANRLLAIFANLPIGIPYSASFRVRFCTSMKYVPLSLLQVRENKNKNKKKNTC